VPGLLCTLLSLLSSFLGFLFLGKVLLGFGLLSLLLLGLHLLAALLAFRPGLFGCLLLFAVLFFDLLL